MGYESYVSSGWLVVSWVPSLHNQGELTLDLLSPSQSGRPARAVFIVAYMSLASVLAFHKMAPSDAHSETAVGKSTSA